MAFTNVRRNMSLAKYRGFPDAPTDLQLIKAAFENDKVQERFGQNEGAGNVGGGRLVYVGAEANGKKEGFAVFKSPSIVAHLPQMRERKYFVDGTFAVMPIGKYDQLLVFHVEHLGRVSYNSRVIIEY